MGVVSGLVVAASVVAGVMLASQGVDEEQPVPASIFTPAPDLLPIERQRQVTLLVQVRDDEGAATSNVLLGAGGGTGFVAELDLPSDLLLPTVPPSRLSTTGGPTEPGRAQDAIETLLGVQVDATLDIARLAWTGLVDSVSEPGLSDRAQDPTQAAGVVSDVVAALPDDEELIGQQVTSLGSMARTSVPNSDIAHLLAVLRVGLRTLPLREAELPVTTLRAGEDPLSIVDQPEAEAVVARLFPEARLQPGHAGPKRVVLQRAGASLGSAAAARLDLLDAGFGVVQQSAPVTATTIVYVPEATDAAKQAGIAAATALGLTAAVVQVDGGPSPTVDVRVVLGSDFVPV